jgi:hypothetical protein
MERDDEVSRRRIRGQDSYVLRTRSIALALTVNGAHLAPVTFFPEDRAPISPYAIAPWAEEPLPSDTPPLIASLRGDWFCSAFGANTDTDAPSKLPLHGETANAAWQLLEAGQTDAGCWLRLGVDLPLQGGRCQATTALLNHHSVIYQRHDLTELTGPCNPGHHATLALPNKEGTGRLSFSRLALAHTWLEPIERPENHGYSYLQPGVGITDLRAAPCSDGSTTDLLRYPARRGYEDLALLCADPTLPLAWSALTVPDQRFAWFALRNPKQLASTLLWFSNGGRHYAPWSGRHINVLGIEDITAFFHIGLNSSCRPNILNERGIPTCLHPDATGRLSIPYIQGVARIPPEFDEVLDIEPQPGQPAVLLRAKSGVTVEVDCRTDFLNTGLLPELGFT